MFYEYKLDLDDDFNMNFDDLLKKVVRLLKAKKKLVSMVQVKKKGKK